MEDILHMSTQSVLIALAIGLVGGFIASLIMGAKGGLIRYLVAGVIGSFILPVVLGFFNMNGVTDLLAMINVTLPDVPYVSREIVSRVIDSTAGAVIVLLIARVLA